MMKNINALLTAMIIILAVSGANAQSAIVVEEVDFSGEFGGSKIPRVKDKGNPANPAVVKINSVLLEKFSIESFNPKDAEDFRWSGVSSTSQIKSGILFLEYSGEYMGAYPNAIEEELFFDLTTGEQLKNRDIPFQSLFTLEGYLDFLSTHWLTGAKKAFQEAIVCADSEPYCSPYDITYSIENARLLMSLESDCYPHAAMACSPVFTRSVAIDSVKKYLSVSGEKILLRDQYANKRGVDKYLYNNVTRKEIPNNLYLFGLIDEKYAISMAVNIGKSGEVKGYYYYDKRKQKISLTGRLQDGQMRMTETVNGQITGEFSMVWTDPEKSGQWSSPDGKKKFPVMFTIVKLTN